MQLEFLDRAEELTRIRKVLEAPEGNLAVLFGRRRCGKSRLLLEALPAGHSVYFVGDDRSSPLQRAALATEIGRLLEGFDQVVYPDWEALLKRWWEQAPRGAVLALDEFPALVAAAQELPSLLQKRIDASAGAGVHLVLAGSSQRMMQGLVLDRSAPLFGRAREILRIDPLPAGWIQRALRLRSAAAAVEAFSVWGGVPRYWELAADFDSLAKALSETVLNPLGVLHDEPQRILLDDLRDTAQAASILSLIGLGCRRLSKIAGRLEKPATSLTRPLQRLIELGLVVRDQPHGSRARHEKRSYYRIADPFLQFWFRFVEPNRSRLQAHRIDAVHADIEARFAPHVAQAWEDLARASVPRLEIGGRTFGPASRCWGAGLDSEPLEIDIVAESEDRKALLFGECKWSDDAKAPQVLAALQRKAERFPERGSRTALFGLWLKRAPRSCRGAEVLSPAKVLRALER